jgi:hypothetical protein
MNSEHDRIIDRYITGRMNPAEEADFRMLLDLDSDLRRLLEAERFVQGTLTKERTVLAGRDHSRTYAGFLQGLASSAVASREAFPAAVAPAPDPTQWGAGRQAVVSAVILLAFVGMMVLIGRFGADEPTTPQARPATEAGANQGEGNVRTRDLSAPGTSLPGRALPAAIGRKAADITVESSKPPSRMSAAAMNVQTPTREQRGATVDSQAHREPPTFYDDTLRTHIDLSPKR